MVFRVNDTKNKLKTILKTILAKPIAVNSIFILLAIRTDRLNALNYMILQIIFQQLYILHTGILNGE